MSQLKVCTLITPHRVHMDSTVYSVFLHVQHFMFMNNQVVVDKN